MLACACVLRPSGVGVSTSEGPGIPAGSFAGTKSFLPTPQAAEGGPSPLEPIPDPVGARGADADRALAQRQSRRRGGALILDVEFEVRHRTVCLSKVDSSRLKVEIDYIAVYLPLCLPTFSELLTARRPGWKGVLVLQRPSK